MAVPGNKMVTYNDVQDMIDNEGFRKRFKFTPTNQCVNKTEIIEIIHFDQNDEFDTLADNQLVPRRTLDSDSDIPTTPVLTTVPFGSYGCIILNTWTTSIGQGTVPVPTIVSYELQIEGFFGEYSNTIKNEIYTVDGIGGGNFDFGQTGVTYQLPRTGADYTFTIRATDSNGSKSLWSSTNSIAVTLEYPYFTNKRLLLHSYDLRVEDFFPNQYEGICAAGITPTGTYVYFYIDRGEQNYDVYGFRLLVPGDLSSISIPAYEDTLKGIQVITHEHRVLGGIISDDGKHSITIGHNRTIYYAYNDIGWHKTMEFNQNHSAVLYEVGEITEIKMNPEGTRLFVSDAKSMTMRVLKFNTPWDLNGGWAYSYSFDIGEGDRAAQGYKAKSIKAFSFIENGYAIRAEVVFYDELDSTYWEQVVYIHTTVPYYFSTSFGLSERTVDWHDECTDAIPFNNDNNGINYTNQLIYNMGVYPPESTAVTSQFGGVYKVYKNIVPDTYELILYIPE